MSQRGPCCTRRAQADLEQERNGRIEAEDVVSRLKAQLRDVRDAETASRLAAEQTLEQLQEEFGADSSPQVRRCSSCSYTPQPLLKKHSAWPSCPAQQHAAA